LLVDAVLPNSAVHYFPTRRSSDLLFITERGTTGLPSQQNDATGLNLTFQRDLWAGGSAAATGTAVNLPTGHVHSLVRGVRNFNKVVVVATGATIGQFSNNNPAASVCISLEGLRFFRIFGFLGGWVVFRLFQFGRAFRWCRRLFGSLWSLGGFSKSGFR